ncbi:MAG: hypothetical protein GF400_09345, partial [Candidatus Eisenbacteria bacterium]|nr:hypothetical protein [Candidatus Eisenbacteria bacterium]
MARPPTVTAGQPSAPLIATSAALVAAALVVFGCAKPGPPGGGPEDKEPPSVVRTYPSDGALDVDTGAALEVTFSEDMNRLSAERALSSAPALEIRRRRWDGETLIVEPVALPDSTTIVIEIGPEARDYHGVAMGSAHSFAFSTGGVIDRGVIEGTVSYEGEPLPGAIIWACRGAAAADTAGVVRPCGYSTVSGDSGAFRFDNASAADAAYSIVAFLDADADRRYQVAEEPGAIVPEAVFLDSERDSVGGLSVNLVQPREDTSGDEVSEDAPTRPEPDGEPSEGEETPGERIDRGEAPGERDDRAEVPEEPSTPDESEPE